MTRTHALDDAAHRLCAVLEVIFEEQLVGSWAEGDKLTELLSKHDPRVSSKTRC
jgi:hypothetical protein